MLENSVSTPLGIHIKYNFSSPGNNYLALVREVYKSPNGSICADRVIPIIDFDGTVGVYGNRVRVPSRTQSLNLRFAPQKRETPPEDFLIMCRTLYGEVDQYLDFLRVLSDPKNFRGITLLTGFTNSVMANFAVRKLGFHFMSSLSADRASKRSDEVTNIFGNREQLLETRESILDFREMLSKRYG